MGLFGSDDRGTVRVDVTSEMWTAIHAPGLDPPVEVERRGLDVLRTRYEYEEDEVEVVANDPLYRDSARTEYWQAKRSFDARRKLPGHMELQFTRPGTRKPNMKPKREE